MCTLLWIISGSIITPSITPYSEQDMLYWCCMSLPSAMTTEIQRYPCGSNLNLYHHVPTTYMGYIGHMGKNLGNKMIHNVTNCYGTLSRVPTFSLWELTCLWHFARNGHGHTRQWPLRRSVRYGKSAGFRWFRVLGSLSAMNNPWMNALFPGGKGSIGGV